MTKYEIQQRVEVDSAHFEPIPNGDFDTLEAAEKAADELINNLGWDADSLRIVPIE